MQDEAVQRGLYLCAADAGEGGGGGSGQGIGDVVTADKLPGDGIGGVINVQGKAAAIVADVAGVEVGTFQRVQREFFLRAVLVFVAPASTRRSVEVDHQRAIACCVNFAFCTDDAFQRTKSGEVRRRGVGDDGDVGADEGGERGDFAGVVCADFDDGVAVFVGQTQQGKRHANVVVEVTLGGQGLSLLLQEALQDFFAGCFAVGAGDGDEGGTAAFATVTSQGGERREAVFDDDLRQVGVASCFDDGGNGTARFRGFQIVRAVEIFAFEGDEERARRQVAAVGADVEGAEVGAVVFAVAEGGDAGGVKRGV